ncbi:MAG: hypothetical protein J1F66_02305 [Clostridiales bacterium]|nr:hypothetical protein [Clostridiales bacterium]
MKISKVTATDPQTNERHVFTFGTAEKGLGVVTTKGGRLNSYIEFCFREELTDCPRDIEVEFSVDGEDFSLARLHNFDGSVRSVLKKMVDGHWQVVARTRAFAYLEEVFNGKITDMLNIDYVNNRAVEGFHGDLRKFDAIRILSEVKDSIAVSSAQAREAKAQALNRVREYSAVPATVAKPEELDAVNGEIDAVAQEITVATAQLGELKAKRNVEDLRSGIAGELEDTQKKYTKLLERQDEIEELRARVVVRDDVELLIPKVKNLRAVAEQRAEYEKKRYAITSELEWQENELASINAQLEEKQRLYAKSQDKRNRIEAINNELSYIASLYDKNKKLNETLLELNDKQQRLTAEKAMYSNKLENIEKSINEVREGLDAFQIPARSVGELLENVRIDVKIDEVQAQVEKLQSEIAVKESQIAEKESALVIQVKRFRAVAELDVKVTPIKAKDTILQVLDAKYSKLESINTSLEEKLRNLQRASEDYKYRILQLEQSRSRLQNELNKTLLKKQEEFKREVFLNSQKVYSDDASSVFAVTANFHDQEIESLEQEIEVRNLDRDLLLERAYQLDGAIKEIRRHIEVNNAEMATLQREKDNINKRYNEILAQNSNEAVFNYLKALSSDNGTKYLLDVQQEAVRSEAELNELKRSTESLRQKLSSLRSRLRYLKETQQQLDDTQASVDTLVSTNDKLKDELTDIGDRLSAGYEQYKSVSRQLESIESKLDDVRGQIVEISKTIKVNEAQIAEANLKARRYAGSDDLEAAVANFRYEIGDVESELQMLTESKQITEKEVFKKRLELEKAEWLYESKDREYNELYQDLQFELKLKGLDIDKIAAMDLDVSLDNIRRVITEYDTTRARLSERIDNLYGILKNRPVETVTAEEIAAKEAEIAHLNERKLQLEQQRHDQFSVYVAASAARVRVTAAAAEARAFTNMRDTLNQNEIISLLINDKVKTLLTLATQYLYAFTDASYRLVAEDYQVSVIFEGKRIAYDDLPANVKTAVYVSIVLSMPSADAEDGKWLLFEERINIDRKVLSEMLMSIDNVHYVVDVTREVAPSTIE